MFKLLLFNEISELSNYIDSSICDKIRNEELYKFEVFEKYNLISFDYTILKESHLIPEQIIIYFSKDFLFFICEKERVYNIVNEYVKNDDSNEKILYNFFTNLIKDDIKYIEKIEENITNLENELLTDTKKQCTYTIVSFRRELLKIKKYYEQLNQIFKEMIENENKLINNDFLRYFNILSKKLDRLYKHVLNLRDYVTQVREAYQAQIDIEQNSLMKVFTVVTFIFSPLTLIVGWYGMNLKMPEFELEYGYLLIIILTVCILIFSIVFFKLKKWL